MVKSLNYLTNILAGKEGYAVREENFRIADLYIASEILHTGTAAEIAPVVETDGRVIDTGEPAPITRRLGKRFAEIAGTLETGTPSALERGGDMVEKPTFQANHLWAVRLFGRGAILPSSSLSSPRLWPASSPTLPDPWPFSPPAPS